MSINFFSINHIILSAFDMGLEVCRILLDISNAFDNKWHDELILKQGQNCICSKMINNFEAIVSDRKQIVILNGQCLP